MESKSTRNRFTDEYKQTCVDRALKTGNVAACARELNLSYGRLMSWVRLFRPKFEGKSKGSISLDSDELIRLRRENKILKEECDILKKATAYFSQKQLKRGTPS